MDIILDTNIYVQDFSLTSSKFELLFDYLLKTKSKVIIPEIILKEIEAVYRRKLTEANDEYMKINRELCRFLIDKPPIFPDIDVGLKTAEYMEYFTDNIGASINIIINNHKYYLDEVIRRATQRIKPCTDNGQEIRDVILWLAVLDAASSRKYKKVIFISNNTKQFSKEMKLHDDLLKEAKERKVEIIYYISIDDFIRAHASKIDFINDEWFKSEMPPKRINQYVLDELKQDEEMLLKWAESTGKNVTGYIEVLSTDLELDDYYIYEKTDGSLYLQCIYEGQADIEIEYIDETESALYIEESEMTKTKTYSPIIRIILSFILKDNKIVDMSTVELNVD